MSYKQRDLTIDASRGLGIIAVVIGHAGNSTLSLWVNWMHMPFFMIVSGYFFQPKENIQSLINYTTNQFKKMIIPYFIYGIILCLITNPLDLTGFINQFGLLIYGGSALGGVFGPFWFITSLLLTKILFAILMFNFSKRSWIIKSTSLFLYIIGHFLSSQRQLAEIDFFWSIESLTMTLYFYSFGYFYKPLVDKVKNNKTFSVIANILIVSLIILASRTIYTYEFNIKDTIYNHLILDAIIPLILSLNLISIASFLSIRSKKLLSLIGKHSLTIMYTHIALIIIFDRLLSHLIQSELLLIIFKITIGISGPILYQITLDKIVKFLNIRKA